MQHQALRHFGRVGEERRAAASALSKVKKAMETYLFDPGSATYTRMQRGRGGAVCGKYNAKNRYGAYVGYKDFVLTADGELFASDANGGIETSSNTDYIEAYLKSCGTAAQKKRYNESSDFDSTTDMNMDISNLVVDEVDEEPDRVLDAPEKARPPEKPDVPTA